MAVASAVGDGGDLALAEDSEICFCRPRSAPRPGAVRSRLAHDRSRRRVPRGAGAAFRCRRRRCGRGKRLAAGRHAGRAAGSGGEHFQNPGIGARHDAGLVRHAGRRRRRPVLRKFSAKLAGKPRRHGGRPRPSRRIRCTRLAPSEGRRDRRQARGAGQKERPIGSRCRLEEALTAGSDRMDQDRRPARSKPAIGAAQFVTILAMQSRMTMARNSRSI